MINLRQKKMTLSSIHDTRLLLRNLRIFTDTVTKITFIGAFVQWPKYKRGKNWANVKRYINQPKTALYKFVRSECNICIIWLVFSDRVNTTAPAAIYYHNNTWYFYAIFDVSFDFWPFQTKISWWWWQFFSL